MLADSRYPRGSAEIDRPRQTRYHELSGAGASTAPVAAMSTKTYVPKASQLSHDWYVMDAEGKTLGRVATAAATLLRGKHKPDFTPFLKTGDFVVVVNAEKVCLTGKKETDKVYYRHTGHPGGLRKETAREVREKHPERLVQRAVAGMLPKNKLGRQLKTRLKVYVGPDHPHQAQQPKVWAV